MGFNKRIAHTTTTLMLLAQAFASMAFAAEPDKLFEPIRSVLQHPRCQNCHIAGDQPLQYDEGKPHSMLVMRGMSGFGMPAMQCSACHQEKTLRPPWVTMRRQVRHTGVCLLRKTRWCLKI